MNFRDHSKGRLYMGDQIEVIDLRRLQREVQEAERRRKIRRMLRLAFGAWVLAAFAGGYLYQEHKHNHQEQEIKDK